MEWQNKAARDKNFEKIRKKIITVKVFRPVILLDLATFITNFLTLLSKILYSGLKVFTITQVAIGICINTKGYIFTIHSRYDSVSPAWLK